MGELSGMDGGRRRFLELLDCHRRRWPDDTATVLRVGALVRSRADCFERRCFWPGHVTASAWILSPDGQRSLLTHHKKLGRWLRLGGHADGVADPLEVARNEAREESGMHEFQVLLDGAPIDVDVHTIPARGCEPEHEHHDVRYLLRAAPGQTIVVSDESLDLRWFTREEVEAVLVTEGKSLARMARRAWAQPRAEWS